jgi:hypothetical protein
VKQTVWLLAVVAAVATAASCGSGSKYTSALSNNLQRAVVKTLPRFAYVPTRLPAGYHYSDYTLSRYGFDAWFSKAGETPNQLGYHVVVKARCAAMGSAMHSFTMNGVTVSWSATYEDQQAWRCVTRDHVPFVVSASRSIAGDDVLTTRKTRDDARDLVRLVAYTKQIH